MSNLDAQAVAQKIRQIWREVLEMKEGQEAATFFDLKGDSISAVRLVARVEDELGVAVDVGDIFEEDPDLPTFLRDVLAAHEGREAAA